MEKLLFVHELFIIDVVDIENSIFERKMKYDFHEVELLYHLNLALMVHSLGDNSLDTIKSPIKH